MFKRRGRAAFRVASFTTLVWLSTGFFPVDGFPYDSTNPEKYRITAVHIDREIQLTGKLSDPLWQSATPVELNYEIQPGENTPARQRTLVYVLFSSDRLYFGFRAFDSDPKAIRSHITDRDRMTDDDFVGVILDTYGTMQSGYEFFVNTYGIQFDAMRTSNNEDGSFDCVWYSAGNVNDTGYTAEMAIPFKSLRFAPDEKQHWMVEFLRNLPRDSRYQMTWTPIDRNNPCILCQGGTIEGIQGIEAANNLELLPYAMAAQTGSMGDVEDPASEFTAGPIKGRVGIGLKYAPSSDLVLGAVVNPDFSQIESDAAQISVNNTFSIFYPEKRPFFLEGADLFGTLASAFYSRMINNPLGASKLTQKSGSFSLAYLVAYDRESPFIVPGEEGSDFVGTSEKSLSNVVRAKYDFGSESFIGGLFTSRNFSAAHNYMGGLDWNFLFAGNFYFVGQALLSDTRELNNLSIFDNQRHYGSTQYTAAFDGEQYGGGGMQADLKRNARDYSFDLSYVRVSPTFQAQDGFITSTNTRVLSYWHGYWVYLNNSIIENASLQTSSGLHFNDEGFLKEKWTMVGLQLQLKGQTYVWVDFLPLNDEIFHSVPFGKIYRTEFTVNSNLSSTVAIYFNGSVGRFIYRADQPELGRGNNFWIETVVKPTDKLSADVSYARSRLWSVNDSHLFYDGYIVRGVFAYQFSSEFFVRLISQYDQFAKQIQVDPMISYKLNPFTVFYVGSNHGFAKFSLPYGVERTVQQFFIKIQYLWQS
ncbi:MAG TPA: DUF5916 domain-containing protein [Candidatus Kryptobacter bacterium]|nr:DUF5916 domain-containing protein [Candidatus Kryptobacter bacterium]